MELVPGRGSELRRSEVIAALSHALDMTEGHPVGPGRAQLPDRHAHRARAAAGRRGPLRALLRAAAEGRGLLVVGRAHVRAVRHATTSRSRRMASSSTGRSRRRSCATRRSTSRRRTHRARPAHPLGAARARGRGQGDRRDALRPRRDDRPQPRLPGRERRRRARARRVLGRPGPAVRPERRGDPAARAHRLPRQTAEVFFAAHGVAAAHEMVRERRGRWFDPEVADVAARDRPRRSRSGATSRATTSRRRCSPSSPPSACRSLDEAGLDRICEAFADVIDAKSPFTARHSRGVAAYAGAIAEQLGLRPAELRELHRAGLLHDIGKLGDPEHDPRQARQADRRGVRAHAPAPAPSPRRSSRGIPAFADFAAVAAAHHERLDGRGYHRGVPAGDLPLSARALAVADVFEALTADRPYRSPMEPEPALAIARGDAGHLDQHCVEALAAGSSGPRSGSRRRPHARRYLARQTGGGAVPAGRGAPRVRAHVTGVTWFAPHCSARVSITSWVIPGERAGGHSEIPLLGIRPARRSGSSRPFNPRERVARAARSRIGLPSSSTRRGMQPSRAASPGRRRACCETWARRRPRLHSGRLRLRPAPARGRASIRAGRCRRQWNALPGEPVPGYEQRRDSYDEKDVDAFWESALARERENKKNAAEFVGDYASAMVEMWAKEVSAAMAEAGKQAGWSFFDKALEVRRDQDTRDSRSCLAHARRSRVFAALGKELSEHVIEKGTEALLAYGGEHVAEALEEKKKDSDIEVAQEDPRSSNRRVCDGREEDLGRHVHELARHRALYEWLSQVRVSQAYWELEKFRLPARFPIFDRDYVRAIVAGLVVTALHLMKYAEREPVEGEPEDTVRGGDENVIYVGGRDLDYAKIESPSRRLTWALAYALPIHELPTVPTGCQRRPSMPGDDPEAAERVMGAFRGLPAALPGEAAEFLEAYDATYASMLVTEERARRGQRQRRAPRGTSLSLFSVHLRHDSHPDGQRGSHLG